MLAVCIIFLSSFLSVFVATLYLEGHTLAKSAHFFHNYNIVFDGHSHSPEEYVLLRLTSTMVIAPGEGAVCHLCTNSSCVFHYIF